MQLAISIISIFWVSHKGQWPERAKCIAILSLIPELTTYMNAKSMQQHSSLNFVFLLYCTTTGHTVHFPNWKIGSHFFVDHLLNYVIAYTEILWFKLQWCIFYGFYDQFMICICIKNMTIWQINSSEYLCIKLNFNFKI